MLNPRICAKCRHGVVDPPTYDRKTGERRSLWSVDCNVGAPLMLFMVDEAPDACPFLLEHKVSMEKLSADDKKYMSNQ